MAFPYTTNTEEAFEAGAVNTTVWNGTNVDTNSKTAVRHYTWMARQDFLREVPYVGAYAWHINLAGGTADAYLESTNWATALDGSIATRFAFLATGLTMGASDRFGIFALQSAGPVTEAMVEIRMSSGDLQILASEVGGATVVASALTQGVWHVVQLVVTVDAGGGNDGSVQLYVDGRSVGTIASLDQAAITQARLGVTGLDAGSTAGHLFFDHIVADTAILPASQRNPLQMQLTTSGHVCVGRGQIQERVTLDSGDGTLELRLYDTDVGDTTARQIVPEAKYNDRWDTARGGSLGHFERGVYAEIVGTTPLAFLSFHERTFAPGGVANVAFSRP